MPFGIPMSGLRAILAVLGILAFIVFVCMSGKVKPPTTERFLPNSWKPKKKDHVTNLDKEWTNPN